MNAETGEKPAFSIRGSEQLMALPAASWLVKGVLPTTGLAVIYGPSGSGKSFLALDLVNCIASGTGWYGKKTRRAQVIYCALEGEGGMSNRLRALKKNSRWMGPMLFATDPLDLASPDNVAALIDAASGFESDDPRVIVVDTLNRASPGADENSGRDMSDLIRGCKDLEAGLNALVLLVHHTGKDAGRGMRGHSSLLAAADAAIEVTRSTNGRFWNLYKSKDGADGGGGAFELKVIDLGEDGDGDAITSCVAVRTEGKPAAKPLPDSMRFALRTLIKTWESSPQKDSTGRPAVADDAWRSRFYTEHSADNQASKKKAWARARKDLQQAGLVEFRAGDALFDVGLRGA